MEERIRVRIGTVLNDNGVDILSEDGGSLLHGLYRVIEQELDKAREEGRREELKSLDKWYYERLEKEFNPFGYVLHEEIFKRISKLTTK